MATKKGGPGNFEADDYDFDGGLDMPDFDFDAKEPPDNRKPTTKIATSFAAGAKDAVLSGTFLRNQIKKNLPQGYGKGLDLADQSVATLRNLYNTSATELKPMVSELKRTTKRVMPAASKFLPKSAADLLTRWSNDDDKKGGTLSADQIREDGLNAQLGDIFKYQQQQEGQNKAEAEAKAGINEQIALSRHRDQLGQLDAIRLSTSALQQYQDKVTSQYQRKSLELQYRSYFVAMDALEEQKKVNVTTTEQLANIAKNTALPEYVKITQSERAAEMLRNKFMSGVADTIFNKRNGFLRDFQKNLVKGVKTRVGDFASNVRSGISAADSILDIQEMQAEMGGGPEASEIIANMAGGAVGDSLGTRIGKAFGKVLRKNKGVRKFGNKLAYTAENLPQTAWDYAEGNKHDDAPIIGGIVRLIKEAAGNGRADNSMDVDSLKSMQQPGIFTNQTRKTINEVIPGLLARMYQELQIIRTGDSSIDLMRYDFKKNKFSADKAIRQEAYSKLVSKSDIASHQEDVDKLLNEVDPDKTKLSPEARKALGQQLLRDNLKNKLASPERLSDYNTWSGGATGAHADNISEVFGEHFKGDDEGARALKFSQGYNRLGRGFSDTREQTQEYLNAGFHDLLRDMGLLGDDGQFDQNKLVDYYNGSATYDAKGSLATGGVRKRGLGGPRGGGSGPRNNGPQPRGPVPPTPSGPADGGLVGRLDTSKLESLVSETSVKSEVTQIVDILTKIAAGLEKGINLNLTDDDADPDSVRGRKRKKFSDYTVKDGIDGAAGGLRWGFNKGSKFANELYGNAFSAGKKAWGGIKAGFGKGKDWAKGALDDFSDVYIDGKVTPLLQSWRLKGGKYKDEATGKILSKWSEATGAIRDIETGELITPEQMKDAFSKTKYGKALFTKVGELKDWGMKKLGQGITMANTVYGGAWTLAKHAYGLLDQPCDVYVQGRSEPVLLAMMMRAGNAYFSKLNKHPITKPSQIDGPVVNEKGEEVLTEEMLKGGIYGQDGKVLKTGWRKALQFGVDIATKGWDRLKKMGKWAKDKATGLYNGASDLLGGAIGKITGPDGLIVAGGSKIHDVLIDIYNLLDMRLKGKPTGLHAGQGSTGGKGGGIASGASRLRQGLKDRFKEAKLEEKLEAAKAKAKKIVGDLNGDGIRDGSWQDEAAKKAKIARDKLTSLAGQGRDKGEGLWSKGKGGLASLLAGWRKKDEEKKEEPEEDAAADIAEKVGENAPEKETKEDKRKRKREERRRMARARKKTGMGGRFARGAARGRTAAGMAGRGLGAVARVAGSGLGSTAMGAARLGGAALMGGGGLAVDLAVGAAGMIPGLVGGVMGVGGALLSGAAALLASPVVLGALAIGAVGAAAYYGYKYLTKKRLDTLSTVRYAQYGFIASDEDHLQPVMGLEDKVFKGVKFTDGVATLSMDGLDVKDMAESFGVDLKNAQQVNSWFGWFKDRFKPVYLTALTAAYKTNPKVKLEDVDKDLSATERQTFLNLAKFLEGPYNVLNSPFDATQLLQADYSVVKTAVELAQATIAKLVADHPATEAEKLAQAAALGAGAATMDQLKDAEGNRFKSDAEKAAYDKAHPKINAGNRMLIGGGMGAGTALTIAGANLPKSRIKDGKVDALTCVRYKTYGLVEMELPKVKAIDALEMAMEKDLTFGSTGIATWKGDPNVLMTAHGGDFGVVGTTNQKAQDWLAWFNYRYLPTYLNYATSVKRNTGKESPSQGADALKPVQAIDVATAIYTTTSAYDSRMLPVWTVTRSPFFGYVLNGDVKSIDANMQALKNAAKSVILNEAKGKITDETLNKPENALLKKQIDQYAPKKGVDFSKNPSMLLSTVDKAGKIDQTKFTGAYRGGQGQGYSMLLNGANGYTGGSAVNHPGNGTGGDINKLPDAKGKGWAAMKDLILGASSMAGVDPSLMAAIAAVESGFNPSVGAGTSSATGLYQFTGGTWTDMMREFGAKYGIDPGTKPTDARANALLGAEFLKKNLAGLQGSLGRQVTDTDIYMAHFLGLGGARKFLSADPNTIAAQLMPDAAGPNRPIFYDGARARTTGEIYQLMGNKIKSSLGEFGVKIGAPAPATPAGMPALPPAANDPSATPSAGPAVPSLLAPMGPKASGAPAPEGMMLAGPTSAEIAAKRAYEAANPLQATPAVLAARKQTEDAMNESVPAAAPASTANPLGIKVRDTSPAPVAASMGSQVPAAVPSGPSVEPEVGRSLMALSPRARNGETQQADSAASVAAAANGTTAAVLAGNAIATAQLDVMKQVLAEIKRNGSGNPMTQQGGAPQAQPRQAGLTPTGPVSLKKPA